MDLLWWEPDYVCGSGWDIVDGLEEQNKYMKFINPHVNEEGIVDNISIKFISGVY